LDKARLEDLGQAKRVEIDKDSTIIIDGAGSPAAIHARIAEIKADANRPRATTTRRNCRSVQRALSGVALIKVAGRPRPP